MTNKRRGNSEGSLHQRPNGSWRAQLTLQGKRLSFTNKNRRECQEWIRKTRDQIDEGLTYSSTKLNLGDYLSDWLSTQRNVFRPSTWSHYSQLLEMYISPNIGHYLLKDVKTGFIQALHNHLLQRNVGIPTIQKIHKFLRSSLGDAEETGLIVSNPVSHTHPPREPDQEMGVLNENQIGQFLASINGHKWETLFFLEIMTGMRRGELLALQWEDLDWLKKTIRIDKQLSKTPNTGMMFQPLKTKESKRTIELSEISIQILKSHYERQRLQRVAGGEKWIEHGLIFTNSKGGPLNAGHITKVFHEVIVASGLPALKFHGLRHSHATILLIKGIPTLVVSKRLGHSRPSTTLNVYGHMVDGMGSEAVKILDDLVPIKLHPNCTQLSESMKNATDNERKTIDYVDSQITNE